MDRVLNENNVSFYQKDSGNNSRNFCIPSEDENDESEDLYGSLGYGYQAYFSSLQKFGWFFVLMTIFFLPAFFWYKRPAGLKSSSHGYYNSAMMLGNMGFNRAICISDYL